MFSSSANSTCGASWPATSRTTTWLALTSRSTRTHPMDGRSSRRRPARSSRFPKSVACIIALVGAGARSRRVVGESDVSDSGLAPVCAEVDLSGDCPVEFEGRIFSFFFHVTGDTNYRPRLASKTKRAAGPTRQPSAPSVTGVGTLLLRFQDVRCDEHGRGRPLILRPMHSFLSLRPRVTLRMLFHRTTLTVLSECALYDVRDGRPVLMRVDPDNTARLKVENPQPKLPSLHPFDLGGEVMSNCLLDR